MNSAEIKGQLENTVEILSSYHHLFYEFLLLTLKEVTPFADINYTCLPKGQLTCKCRTKRKMW